MFFSPVLTFSRFDTDFRLYGGGFTITKTFKKITATLTKWFQPRRTADHFRAGNQRTTNARAIDKTAPKFGQQFPYPASSRKSQTSNTSSKTIKDQKQKNRLRNKQFRQDGSSISHENKKVKIRSQEEIPTMVHHRL